MKVISRVLLVFSLWLAAIGMALAQSPPVQVWGVNSAGQIWQSSGGAWTNVPGAASQASVAADGSVWVVNAGGQVFRRVGKQWEEMTGAPVLAQVSVRNANDVWGLGKDDAIFHWTGSDWAQVGGRLTSISVAADGGVWGVNRGGAVLHRVGNDWQGIQGQLVQISAARDNDVWGVNANNDIWRWNGSGWAQIPGKLKQVAAGADGSVWGLAAADGAIVRREGENWTVVQGGLVQVAIANPANIVVNINPAPNITPPPVVITPPSNYIAPPPVVLPTPNVNVSAPTQPIVIAGTGSIDVTPGAPTKPTTPTGPQLEVRGTIDGTPLPTSFGIGPVGSSKATCGTPDTGKLCRPVAASFVHNASALCPSGTFPDVGKWSCWSCPKDYERSAAAVDSDKACQQKDSTQKGGYLAAIFHGRLCASGTFFDPIRGGECYSCPPNYKRSAAHIDAANACYIPAGETLKAATKSKSTIWPHECGSGTFWDGINGGGCWSCPSGYNRTGYAVNTDKACSTATSEKQSVAKNEGKAACDAGEFYDMRIQGDQDISAGGGCWSCPIATDRTILPVDGSQACQRAPGLRFASATQAKALNCESKEIFDPISSSNSLMSAAFNARNALPGDKEIKHDIGGTCWTCPAGTKRNVLPIYGAACQPLGITWQVAPYNQPGLFGLNSAEAVALKLVAERTTINKIIEGMKTGPEGSKLPADFARSTWDQIGKSPQDSAVLQLAVFSRVVAAAKERASASPEEIALLEDVIAQVRNFRIYVAQNALDSYRAWKGGQTFRQNQYPRSQLQSLFDVDEVPPDFDEISMEAIMGSMAAQRAANAAIVASITSDAVFQKLFPFAERGKFVTQASVDALAKLLAERAAIRLGEKVTEQSVKAMAGTARATLEAAGTMTSLMASIGPQIIVTIGIEILMVAIEQQIDIANAEPKLLTSLATAKNLKVDFNRMMSTSAGNNEAQGYWATLMGGPAKVGNTQPAMPLPRNAAAFAAGAAAAKAGL